MNTFNPHCARGGASVPILLFLILIGGLWYGGEGVYVAIKNRRPTTLKCGDLAKGPPSAHWLILKDCEIEMLDSAYLVEKHKDRPEERITKAYLPLRPAGSGNRGGGCHVVLATRDPAILALVNEVRGAKSQGELDFLLLKHAHTLRQRRDVSGLVQFGFWEGADLSGDLRPLLRFLTTKYIVLVEGEQPNLVRSLAAVLAGLTAGGILVYLYFRTNEAATDADWGR